MLLLKQDLSTCLYQDSRISAYQVRANNKVCCYYQCFSFLCVKAAYNTSMQDKQKSTPAGIGYGRPCIERVKEVQSEERGRMGGGGKGRVQPCKSHVACCHWCVSG